MFMRFLFGGFAFGLMRLIAGAGVVILCYLFLLKPVLSTTHDAFKSSGLEQVGKLIGGLSEGVQQEVRRAFHSTKHRRGDTHRLVRCIQHAHGNTPRIRYCARHY